MVPQEARILTNPATKMLHNVACKEVSITMKKCPGCGVIYEDQQRFCQHDGTELETVADDPGPAAVPPPKPPRSGSAWSTFLKKVPRETLAGIVVVGIILAVILAIFTMRQSKLFRLRVTFEEGHSLSVGDSVFIRGVDVGEVVKAEFEGDRFVASLVIDPKATALWPRW